MLIDRIATGGMAEIYLASASGAEGLNKFFALKRILPQHMKDADFVQMFKGEAMFTMNLTQSNIAQIYEFGQEKGQFYLAMEYIEGRDLRQILTKCAEVKDGFTIDQTVFLISEVASGLDFAHRCVDKKNGKPLKLIHRDMSPQNIMVSLDGEVKIIDFGIAKAESRLGTTKAGAIRGKISYMSPEQAMAQDLDGRTDIFSTGIILWELLTGRRLFEVQDEEMVIIQKIKECRIPDVRIYNPRVPEEVHRITMKALTKDRNYRYASARDFHRDLVTCLHKLNPRFTREDLSNLMKRLFQTEIEEYRQRLQQITESQTHLLPPTNVSGNGEYLGNPAEKFDDRLNHSVTISNTTSSPMIINTTEAPAGLIMRPPTPSAQPVIGKNPDWNVSDLMASDDVTKHLAKQKKFDEAQAEAQANPAARARAAPGGGPSPAERIEVIRTLLRQGRLSEARAALRDFRALYPNYLLPDDLLREP